MDNHATDKPNPPIGGFGTALVGAQLLQILSETPADVVMAIHADGKAGVAYDDAKVAAMLNRLCAAQIRECALKAMETATANAKE